MNKTQHRDTQVHSPKPRFYWVKPLKKRQVLGFFKRTGSPPPKKPKTKEKQLGWAFKKWVFKTLIKPLDKKNYNAT